MWWSSLCAECVVKYVLYICWEYRVFFLLHRVLLSLSFSLSDTFCGGLQLQTPRTPAQPDVPLWCVIYSTTRCCGVGGVLLRSACVACGVVSLNQTIYAMHSTQHLPFLCLLRFRTATAGEDVTKRRDDETGPVRSNWVEVEYLCSNVPKLYAMHFDLRVYARAERVGL